MRLISDSLGKKIIIDAPNIIEYKWISNTNTLCIVCSIRVFNIYIIKIIFFLHKFYFYLFFLYY